MLYLHMITVGKEQDPLNITVGPHGLGERNERGDLWTEWCSTHDQVTLNTWFQHHQRHIIYIHKESSRWYQKSD